MLHVHLLLLPRWRRRERSRQRRGGGGEDRLDNLDDNERSVLSPHASVDISRELLDYSHLSESFVLGQAKRSFQSPRRLFDEDCGDENGDDGEEEDCARAVVDAPPFFDSLFEATNDDDDVVVARGKADGGGAIATPRRPPPPPPHHHTLPRFVRSVLCIATTPPITPGTTDPATPHRRHAQRPPSSSSSSSSSSFPPPSSSCPASPNVSTFYGKWGSRRERRVSTLPSLEFGRPVRLRVAALRSSPSCSSSSRGDYPGGGGMVTAPATPDDDYYFSYDPHFSPAGNSEYSITTSSGHGGGGGRPYGNGLALRMGGYDGRRGGSRRNYGGGGGDDSRRRRRRRLGAASEGEGAESGGFASASQFMILEDRAGSVPCVIKSLRTHDVMPSAVVYAPMARYEGQVPSGHRLTRRRNAGGGESGEGGERRGGGGGGRDDNNTNAAVVIDDDDGEDDAGGRSEALYPWALIRKGGRTMEDECLVHLVKNDGGRKAKAMGGRRGSSSSTTNANNNNNNIINNNNNGGGGSIFHPEPIFRGRHGFDERGLHTHTVVSRTIASAMTGSDAPTTTTKSSILRGGGKKTNAKKGDASRVGRKGSSSADDGNPTSLEEVPCCLIVRDPSDLDAVDLTIAPGIDPLLMICYLASHSKMDVECIVSGYG